MASFNSPGGLRGQGGGLFSATSSSGNAMTGAPYENGLGSITPGGMEMSNVDLAVEIPSMMMTQRNFQANIKIIQAGDEMLGHLLNVKT